jgi:hypothetical protein
MNTKLLSQLLVIVENNITKYTQYEDLLIESGSSKTLLEDFANTTKNMRDNLKKPSENIDFEATKRFIEFSIRICNIVKVEARLGLGEKNSIVKLIEKDLESIISFVRTKFQNDVNIRQSDLDVETNADNKKALKKDFLLTMRTLVNDIKCLKGTNTLFVGNLKNKSMAITAIDAFSFSILKLAAYSLYSNAHFQMDILKPKNADSFDMDKKYEFEKAFKEFSSVYDEVDKQLSNLDKDFIKLSKSK